MMKARGMVMFSRKKGAEIWGLQLNAVAGELSPAFLVPTALFDPVQ